MRDGGGSGCGRVRAGAAAQQQVGCRARAAAAGVAHGPSRPAPRPHLPSGAPGVSGDLEGPRSQEADPPSPFVPRQGWRAPKAAPHAPHKSWG